MTSKKRKSPVDRAMESTVVVCEHCKWRDIVVTPGHAWYVYARHLKAVHGDLRAAERARKRAWDNGYTSKTDSLADY